MKEKKIKNERKNMQLRMITFNLQLVSGQEVFGFKIIPLKDIKIFKEAIRKLEQEQHFFTIADGDYTWNKEYFDIMEISTMESKILNNVFDLDISNGCSKIVGIFPDPIQQAYDEGLMDEDQEYDDYADDEDDEF